MIRLEGPTLPKESQGAVPPILFGDLLRDVPGIPLQVGWTATLADNCGIDASDVSVKLGGADLAETLALVPASGVVQIENEWLTYGSVRRDPPRLTIGVRGYRGTVPAAHSKGTTVYFVETRPLYVLAYVPPGCTYPDDMVAQLRVNDNAETPPCTVRLQDERLVPGVRLVTVEFDAGRAFYQAPAPALPSTVLASGIGPVAGDVGGGVSARPPLAVSARASRPVAGGYGALRPPAPAIGLGGSPPGTGGAYGRAPERTLELRQGALGRVTADLRGLRDTGAGRYSGVSLGPLVAPAAIVRLLLEETYGETSEAAYHAPTWAATAARHAARGWTWRLAWRGDAFEGFRDAAQRCGQADLYLDEDGRWRYAFRDPVAPAVATLTARELLGDPAVGWTAGRDVITVLEVAWGAGVQGGTLTLDSPHMITRHGRNAGGVALPYAASEAIARQLGRYQLSRRDRPRQSVTLSAAHATLALTVTDRLFVDTPLLGLYGAQRVPFELVGVTDRGDERVLTCLEADPLARELLLAGTLTRGGERALALAGSLDVELLAQILTLAGTLVRPGVRSRVLRGTLVRPGVVSRMLAGTLDVIPPTPTLWPDGFRYAEPGTRIDY